jgi:hypothetical protein
MHVLQHYFLKLAARRFQMHAVAPQLHFDTAILLEYSDANVIVAHADVLAPARTAVADAAVADAAVAAAAVADAAVAAAAVADAAVADAAVAAAADPAAGALDDANHVKAATLAGRFGCDAAHVEPRSCFEYHCHDAEEQVSEKISIRAL